MGSGNLFEAFRESKRQRFEYLRLPARVSLAWASALWEEKRHILGDDPWAYNVRDNIRTIRNFMEYSLVEGRIERELDIPSLFVEGTREI